MKYGNICKKHPCCFVVACVHKRRPREGCQRLQLRFQNTFIWDETAVSGENSLQKEQENEGEEDNSVSA